MHLNHILTFKALHGTLIQFTNEFLRNAVEKQVLVVRSGKVGIPWNLFISQIQPCHNALAECRSISASASLPVMILVWNQNSVHTDIGASSLYSPPGLFVNPLFASRSRNEWRRSAATPIQVFQYRFHDSRLVFPRFRIHRDRFLRLCYNTLPSHKSCT